MTRIHRTIDVPPPGGGSAPRTTLFVAGVASVALSGLLPGCGADGSVSTTPSGTAGAGAGGSDSGGANSGGANSGGANSGGANSGGANSGGSNSGGGGNLSLENNLFPSPMPPGNLAPKDAPQIIVFGWDDCMFTGDHASDLAKGSDNGMNFIEQTFGPMTNPDGSDVHVSFYENGAYLPNSEVGGPWGSETNLTVAAGRALIAQGFELGNHTFDHLEINATWGKIPDAFHKGSLGGWTDRAGTLMDKATWMTPVISFNDEFLKQSYGVSEIFGFRAPRLEINDAGLQALVESGYLYDVNMEEGNQWEYVTAAVKPGTDAKGFKWVVWPHTLDNGSPGVWQSQDFGEKDYLKEFPTGLWESPVYMLYVPDNGLQETIATRMKLEITSENTDWVGEKVREMTAFDFNTFLYARLTKDEWVEIMKYNFLLRYNGNRAPLTFGAHPAEFSWRYDNEVILKQAGNEDFRDVLKYNTYQDRKDAVVEFIQWVKTNYPNDVYFMSNKELIDYMQEPFDKDGNPVGADALATPTVTDFLDLAGDWEVAKDALGSNASVAITGPDTMTIDFTVGTNSGDSYAFVDVATYFAKGTFTNVSHIDIVYVSEAPFRVRLLTEENGPAALQALLAGVGGERTARIRVKDFRPDPYLNADAIAAAGFVNSTYLSEVIGLGIESASTEDSSSFKVDIKKIVVHGLDTAALASGTAFSPESPSTSARRLRRLRQMRQMRQKPTLSSGSSVFWPGHREPGMESVRNER